MTDRGAHAGHGAPPPMAPPRNGLSGAEAFVASGRQVVTSDAREQPLAEHHVVR